MNRTSTSDGTTSDGLIYIYIYNWNAGRRKEERIEKYLKT